LHMTSILIEIVII